MVGLLLVGLSLWGAERVRAGDEACTVPEYPNCLSKTIINQWACETCKRYEYRCTANTTKGCDPGENHQDPASCGYEEPYCYRMCISDTGKPQEPSCKITKYIVRCNTSRGFCRWTGKLTNCHISMLCKAGRGEKETGLQERITPSVTGIKSDGATIFDASTPMAMLIPQASGKPPAASVCTPTRPAAPRWR